MKVKSFLLVGLIVLICSLGVLSLMGRLGNDQEYWRPADMYSTLGGSQGSSYSTVSYGSSAYASADALAVPSSRSMLGRRASFSYAHASMPAYSQSPIAGTASYSQGGLYTTSSADFHSFGGGGNDAMAAMSTSSSRKSVASSAAPMAVSMPSTSVFAQNTRSVNMVAGADAMPSVSGDIAMASSYAGIGNTTGSRGMSGRKNAGPSDNSNPWLVWLSKYGTSFGTGSQDSEGNWSYGYDYYQLKAAYEAYIGSGAWQGIWPDEPSFDDWLNWFMGGSFNHGGSLFYWVPVGEVWCLLLMVLMYGFLVLYRNCKKAAL